MYLRSGLPTNRLRDKSQSLSREVSLDRVPCRGLMRYANVTDFGLWYDFRNPPGSPASMASVYAETIEQAVVREIKEETCVDAEVTAVLGLRSRYDPESGNGIYVVLVLRPIGGEPQPDGREVDRAAYFTLDEIRELTPLPPVNWEIAQRVLSPDRCLLSPKPLKNLNGASFTLFVG